jgi:hypothetical protein
VDEDPAARAPADRPMGLGALLLWGALGVLGVLLARDTLGRGLFDAFLALLGAATVLRGHRVRPLLLCGAWLAFAAGAVVLGWQMLR